MGQGNESNAQLSNTDVLLQAFENTDVSIFMYYPLEKKIIIPKNVCEKYNCKEEYYNIPESIINDFVLPDDYPAVMSLYYKIEEGAKYATSQFHSKDGSTCWRVTLTVLNWEKDQSAKEALAVIEDISEWDKDKQIIAQIQSRLADIETENDELKESKRLIANAIGSQYYAIYHIWLDSRTYICYQEQLQGILSLIGEKGAYEPAWNCYIDNFIEAEDRSGVRTFSDINTLADRLKNNNTITHVYRRKDIGWTRGQFIVAKRDEKGNAVNVLYTVVDINTEKSFELAQSRARYEIMHDSLTDVLNRKGFEESVNSYDIQSVPVGMLIADIDNFKMINDHHGHETGDEILKTVAGLISNIFRSDDSVFRLGGDEFGVVLRNCDESAWKTICLKQEKIHRMLAEEFPNIPVTLSSGLCFSEKGYDDGMYAHADEALYETKRNGRAGCTIKDRKTGKMISWHDDKLSLHTQNMLVLNDTGLYRIEYYPDGSMENRLICGEATKSIFDFPLDATPEECFRLWINGVDSYYIDTIKRSADIFMQGKLAECTYQWKHQKLGKIFIRTGGRGEIENGVWVLYGYHHTLKDTIIVENNDERLIIDAISGIYFCSYYIDLENNSFTILKSAAGEKYINMQLDRAAETLKNAIMTLSHSDDRERMLSFVDFATLPERLEKEDHVDCEYMSLSEKKWCRASFFPVKHNDDGRISKVVYVITSLDTRRAEEAKAVVQSKKSIESLYNNVPGGIVMYEWNGKRLKTIHTSAYYEKEYGYTLNSSDDNADGGPDYKRIHPDDLAGYKKAILNALNVTHELHYEYRVWNKNAGCYLWTKIDATLEVMQDGTSLVYALYTDVTEQKTLELELEKRRESMKSALVASNLLSYEYDPYEHIGICFTDENYFGLPKIINNYPESLREKDLFYPDDVDTFINTAHKMDDNAETAHCDVRIKKNGEYGWYSCSFNSYYDPRKERNVAILTVVDISDRKALIADYENRVALALNMVENSLVVGQCNLTENTVAFFKATDEMKPFVEGVKTFDERMMNAVSCIVDEKDRAEYIRILNREYLIKCAEKGQMHVQTEYMLRISNNHTLWIETGVRMVKNPLNGDIIAISYSKNVQEARISTLLLKNTLKQEYLKTAVVFNDTDEFFVLDENDEKHMECQYGFWTRFNNALQPLLDINLHTLKDEISKDTVLSHIQSDGEYTYSFDSRYYDGEHRLQIRFSYLNKSHDPMLVSLRNITDTALMERLRHDSEHDSLTDLYNRKTVFRKCRELLDAHPEDSFVIAHIDMKHFRLYNTFFGDKAGDKLLCDVADMFRLMDKDYEYWAYGRIEADVFCVFFPYNRNKYYKHLNMVFSILKEYRTDFIIEPVVGLYFIKDRSMPVEAMFSRATIAAEALQQGTPDSTVVYNEEMERKLNDDHRILNEMQLAIENEQFDIYLQPKYSLRTNKPIGAEALVRWNHPQKGIISPGRFIPMFESNGFITTLDRYMWEHVCQLLSKWQREGEKMAPVSVNVSRLSMFSHSTVAYLKDLVKKYDIDPQYLELELTESAYIDDPDEMKIQMRAIRDAGFKILLDDFGSGYSSLNTLRELPVDVLKMDMDFLSHDNDNLRGSLIISSIVRMSKLLNMPVIAEGVETREQADFLRGIGCEYVQGYLFAKPMPVSDYEEILHNHDSTCENKNISEIELIGKMIADDKTGTYILGEVIPSPMALIEYSGGKFACIRANPQFLSEFGLSEDLRPASTVIMSHLDDENKRKFSAALSKCLETEKPVIFRFACRVEDGSEHKFIGNISYNGKIGDAAVMVAVFTNVTSVDFE